MWPPKGRYGTNQSPSLICQRANEWKWKCEMNKHTKKDTSWFSVNAFVCEDTQGDVVDSKRTLDAQINPPKWCLCEWHEEVTVRLSPCFCPWTASHFLMWSIIMFVRLWCIDFFPFFSVIACMCLAQLHIHSVLCYFLLCVFVIVWPTQISSTCSLLPCCHLHHFVSVPGVWCPSLTPCVANLFVDVKETGVHPHTSVVMHPLLEGCRVELILLHHGWW